MAQTSDPSYNILIVSDLHLQEADKNPSGRLFYFDQEFTDFLRYYRRFCEGHRRWRLIIAGDFIEFYLRIHERPTPEDKLLKGIELWPTDLKFFLGAQARKSVWKLDRVVRSHQLLFIALARFILEGNELFILRGNHDLEFFWPEVQTHFRVLLAQFHPAEVSYVDMKAIVEDRVHFVPWFYFDRDLLYVEHGNQYDAYCSNAHNLFPVVPHKPQSLELAMSAFVLRYFHARIEHMEPAAMENINSVPTSFWYLVRSNPGQLHGIPVYILEMIARTLGKVRRVRPEVERPIREMEAQIREDIKATYGVSEEALQAIERLAHPPVLLSRWKTIKCFSLDLLLAVMATVSIGTGLVVTASSTSGRWVSAVACGLVIAVLLFLAKERFSRFNDHRDLRAIARTIREALGCRYVVFGHSHDPDVHPLSASADHCYFNVGTWTPKSKEGQFVYLVLVREQPGPSARLMRWDRTREQPVELDQTSYVMGSAERKAMLAGKRSGIR